MCGVSQCCRPLVVTRPTTNLLLERGVPGVDLEPHIELTAGLVAVAEREVALAQPHEHLEVGGGGGKDGVSERSRESHMEIIQDMSNNVPTHTHAWTYLDGVGLQAQRLLAVVDGVAVPLEHGEGGPTITPIRGVERGERCIPFEGMVVRGEDGGEG